MTRYKIAIEYKGSAFSGWQRQLGIISVQQVIEDDFHILILNSQNMVASNFRKYGNHIALEFLGYYKVAFDMIPDFPYLVSKYADVANENS